MPVTQANPTNPRWQSLECNTFTSHIEPAMQIFIIRKKRFHFCVGLANIIRVARQRDPAEWAFTSTEQGSNIRRDKARHIKRIFHTLIKSDLANVVAVINRGHAHRLKIEQRLHMHRTAFRRRNS